MCECCKDLSENYLQFLNSFVGLIGLGLIIFSALALSELENDYEEIFNNFLLYGPLFFGIGLLLVAILGCVAVSKHNRSLLFIYFFFVLCATVVVLACGAVILAFSGELDEVENANVQDSSSNVVERITDFELAVFQKCCVDSDEFNNGDIDAPELCENDENLAVCITDEERFDDFVEVVGNSVCTGLEEIEIDGAPVVGDVDDGGCGGGSPETFVESLTQYLTDNIRPLGALAVALSVILMFDLIATCVMLWSKKDEYNEKQYYK
eukprot:augustus_masked-scaffold_55-processed-gene-1.53-mRNA-1 protein AED:1.00 eAED:1.00 QI:0/-1/0/0/-1/1/1/0/265